MQRVLGCPPQTQRQTTWTMKWYDRIVCACVCARVRVCVCVHCLVYDVDPTVNPTIHVWQDLKEVSDQLIPMYLNKPRYVLEQIERDKLSSFIVYKSHAEWCPGRSLFTGLLSGPTSLTHINTKIDLKKKSQMKYGVCVWQLSVWEDWVWPGAWRREVRVYHWRSVQSQHFKPGLCEVIRVMEVKVTQADRELCVWPVSFCLSVWLVSGPCGVFLYAPRGGAILGVRQLTVTIKYVEGLRTLLWGVWVR